MLARILAFGDRHYWAGLVLGPIYRWRVYLVDRRRNNGG